MTILLPTSSLYHSYLIPSANHLNIGSLNKVCDAIWNILWRIQCLASEFDRLGTEYIELQIPTLSTGSDHWHVTEYRVRSFILVNQCIGYQGTGISTHLCGVQGSRMYTCGCIWWYPASCTVTSLSTLASRFNLTSTLKTSQIPQITSCNCCYWL